MESNVKLVLFCSVLFTVWIFVEKTEARNMHSRLSMKAPNMRMNMMIGGHRCACIKNRDKVKGEDKMYRHKDKEEEQDQGKNREKL